MNAEAAFREALLKCMFRHIKRVPLYKGSDIYIWGAFHSRGDPEPYMKCRHLSGIIAGIKAEREFP